MTDLIERHPMTLRRNVEWWQACASY